MGRSSEHRKIAKEKERASAGEEQSEGWQLEARQKGYLKASRESGIGGRTENDGPPKKSRLYERRCFPITDVPPSRTRGEWMYNKAVK